MGNNIMSARWRARRWGAHGERGGGISCRHAHSLLFQTAVQDFTRNVSLLEMFLFWSLMVVSVSAAQCTLSDQYSLVRMLSFLPPALRSHSPAITHSLFHLQAQNSPFPHILHHSANTWTARPDLFCSTVFTFSYVSFLLFCVVR